MVVVRRFFIFVLFVVLICLGVVFSVKTNSNIEIENIKVYTSNFENVAEKYKYIKNGNGLIIDADRNNVRELIHCVDSFSGVSFECVASVNEIINYYNVKDVFKENCDSDYVNYYGYIDAIPEYIEINGKKVNFHVCEKNNICKIGIPIILGSY